MNLSEINTRHKILEKLNYLMKNSLYISTIISPILLFPINTYYSNYDTLFTSLLVSFISILYHHKYNIKYIRYIDINIYINLISTLLYIKKIY